MGSFNIRVKPEIISNRVSAAQTRDIDKLAAQFKLDKGEIHGDGVDMNEATHLPFDAFMQLAQGDSKITKDDLLKFAGTETADDVIREYAQHIAESIPAEQMDTVDGSQLAFKVIKRGENILVAAERHPLNNTIKPSATDATAAGVFSIINGRDANGDNQISVAGELSGSAFVNTAGDALKLAQGDMFVSPAEALQAILNKAGKMAVADVEITYKPAK